MIKKNNFALLFIIWASMVHFYSCGFVEPDPVIDDNAKPIHVYDYAPINFQAEDNVCGGIFLRFNPNEDLSKIYTIQMLIDSVSIPLIEKEKYEYFFDTQKFQTGFHNLIFNVYEFDYNVGLLNLLNAPYSTYTTMLYFESKPLPPAPENVYADMVYKRSYPKITWQYPSNSDSLVDYYVIVRLLPTKYVDTIFTHTHTYIDTTLFGEGPIKYKVGAGNEFGTNYTDAISGVIIPPDN